MPPSSFGYVLLIPHDVGSESNIRTLTAQEHSSQDEQEGAMEPKNPVSRNGESGTVNSRDIFPRGMTCLLYRKKEINLNGTHLPTMKRLSGWVTHWCGNDASQIFSSY